MLSHADKQRIEAEESYRTQVREKATRTARTGTTGRVIVRYVLAALAVVVFLTFAIKSGGVVYPAVLVAALFGPLFLLTYVSRVA